MFVAELTPAVTRLQFKKKGEVVQRKDNKRLLRVGFQYRNVAHISDRMLY